MSVVSLFVFVALLSLSLGQLRFNPKDEFVENETADSPGMTFDNTGAAICPPDDGIYEDPSYCDAYWTCTNGRPVETFCEDGLVFDPRKALHSDPCDTPHVVPCGSRQELQEPSFPSEVCPRKYGTFEHPDPTICNIYYQCVNGVDTEVTCATGLYFNGTQGSCNWPGIANRVGCVDKPPVSEDGSFTCPPGEHKDSTTGVKIPHPSFPNAEDCSKFYVCLNGVTPQDASCDKGLVFDERQRLCALPETVPECEGWYANDPAFAHYYEEAPRTRRDIGAQDTVIV